MALRKHGTQLQKIPLRYIGQPARFGDWKNGLETVVASAFSVISPLRLVDSVSRDRLQTRPGPAAPIIRATH